MTPLRLSLIVAVGVALGLLLHLWGAPLVVHAPLNLPRNGVMV